MVESACRDCWRVLKWFVASSFKSSPGGHGLARRRRKRSTPQWIFDVTPWARWFSSLPSSREEDMSTIPQISIVTPSFNQARYIEETLQSVRNQDCPSLEHIVVDGASTDGTVDILKRYSSMPGWQHLRWISEPDSCQCDALNKGFRMAKGNIIGWLNSDDRYESHCVSKVLEALKTQSSRGLCVR